MDCPDNPTKPDVTRDAKGHFVSGSCNPRGRPPVLREVRALARKYTRTAIQTLAEIALNKHANAAARVAACAVLLDRGWGRPEQAIAVAAIDAVDLPSDFVPSDTIAAAALYQQALDGLVTVSSAAEALDRGPSPEGRDAVPPAPSPLAPGPTQGAFHPGDRPSPPSPAAPSPLAAGSPPGRGQGGDSPTPPGDSSRTHHDAPPDNAHDSAGCPTADGALAAQRGRERAAAEARAKNEQACQEESARHRARLAEETP